MSLRRTTIDRLNEVRKASVPTIGRGAPINSEGKEGDITFRRTFDGLKLYIKANGKWEGVKVGESFDSLEQQVENLQKSVNLIRSDFSLPRKYISKGDFTLDASGDIELNADGGQVNIMDDTDIAFVFDCDVPRFRIYDDANSADHFSIDVGAEGATTLATIDADTSVGHMTLQPDGDLVLDPVSKKIIINATDKLYFDGGTHTYIHEDSADSLTFVVGSDTALQLEALAGSKNSAKFGSFAVGFTQGIVIYNASDTAVYFSRAGNKQFLTLTGNVTDMNLTFPDMSGNFVLLVKQDLTGSRTVTNWKTFDQDDGNESTVKWAGGSAPTLTTTAAKTDILSFYWDNANHIAYGVATLNF